jgi:type II secretory pathway component PulC
MVKILVSLSMCFAAFQVDASPQNELDLHLRGTVLSDSGKMMAFIEAGKTGEQLLFRLGDYVEDGRITRISRDRVTLTFDGIEVELLLTGIGHVPLVGDANVPDRVQPPLNQGDDGLWQIKQETLDDLRQASGLDAQVTSLGAGGVRVNIVQPDGLLHELGLRKDDVILNINGRVPGSEVSMAHAFAKTADGMPMLRLEIERQGVMDLLYFEINP